MDTPPDFDAEILCIGKFIFKQSPACSNSSSSDNIFVCHGDELLCEFDCFSIPSSIPNWVSIDKKRIEWCYNSYALDQVPGCIKTTGTSIEPSYHCTLFWQHPELSSLWAEYLAEFDWIKPEKHNNIDPEAWLKELLWRLGFDGLNDFDWCPIAHYFSSD